MKTLQRLPIQQQSRSPLDALAQELLQSVTKIHINHLLITGPGSFAAHKAMNEFYDEIGDLADDVVEHYQGATEQLIQFDPEFQLQILKTKDDCLIYLRDLRSRVTMVQLSLPPDLSNISNVLDEVKSLIDSTKYKLLFLS